MKAGRWIGRLHTERRAGRQAERLADSISMIRSQQKDRQTAVRMASQKVLEGQNAGAETLHDRILMGSEGSMLGREMDGQTA